MSSLIRLVLGATFFAALGALVHVAAKEPVPESVLATVRDLVGAVEPGSVRATASPGLYEVRLDGTFLYVTADGRFFVHGDLYDARSQRNLTELSRRESRLEVVDAIDPDTYIVFAPRMATHTVTVFTDPVPRRRNVSLFSGASCEARRLSCRTLSRSPYLQSLQQVGPRNVTKPVVVTL